MGVLAGVNVTRKKKIRAIFPLKVEFYVENDHTKRTKIDKVKEKKW